MRWIECLGFSLCVGLFGRLFSSHPSSVSRLSFRSDVFPRTFVASTDCSLRSDFYTSLVLAFDHLPNIGIVDLL
ncbi:hypothetical protein F5B18DRAFT_632178 [Nemania serpens]|nr:hypothetical protein F5B18DRAFT_632178 [Nemania serpens]